MSNDPIAESGSHFGPFSHATGRKAMRLTIGCVVALAFWVCSARDGGAAAEPAGVRDAGKFFSAERSPRPTGKSRSYCGATTRI